MFCLRSRGHGFEPFKTSSHSSSSFVTTVGVLSDIFEVVKLRVHSASVSLKLYQCHEHKNSPYRNYNPIGLLKRLSYPVPYIYIYIYIYIYNENLLLSHGFICACHLSNTFWRFSISVKRWLLFQLTTFIRKIPLSSRLLLICEFIWHICIFVCIDPSVGSNI